MDISLLRIRDLLFLLEILVCFDLLDQPLHELVLAHEVVALSAIEDVVEQFVDELVVMSDIHSLIVIFLHCLRIFCSNL